MPSQVTRPYADYWAECDCRDNVIARGGGDNPLQVLGFVIQGPVELRDGPCQLMCKTNNAAPSLHCAYCEKSLKVVDGALMHINLAPCVCLFHC